MISREKILEEYDKCLLVVEKLKREKWVDSDTIIICCSLHSSFVAQLVNSAYIELEQLFLEIPEKDATYIFNREARVYEPFTRYIVDWVRRLEVERKYLFVYTQENERAYILLWNLLRTKYNYQAIYI